ncbi:MAG: DUF4388 domain-containing protein [bacterium]|nr:DUF4388 domain-containing protein [bacterium]
MALQGSLSELSLPDVIQLVSVSGKTGSFAISRDDERGRIYLKKGQIVDASVGTLRGEHAVYEMAIWSRGDFEFVSGEETEQVTVHKSNANLMMEAARRLDEWRVLSRKIPSLDLVPFFPGTERGQDQVTLSPHEWILVTKVDGSISIDDIAAELRWSAFDVSKLLFGMITSGLVELRKPSKTSNGGQFEGGPSSVTLLGLAERIRVVALKVIGASGEKTVEKQYVGARTRIEKGEGLVAIRELVVQNSKAIALLKGSDMAAMFDEQVRPLLGGLERGR